MTGIVGSWELLVGIPQAVYVCNKTDSSVVNVNICNRGNQVTLISMAISTSATTPLNAEWIEFESRLIGKGSIERAGIVINPGQYLIVKSSLANVNVVAWGITAGEVVPSIPAITQNQGGAPVWITPTTAITTGSWDTVTFAAEAASSYSVLSGSLPAGARFEPDSGRMYNFTLPGSTTTSSFTLRATSPTGVTADRAFTLNINTSAIPTPPPPVIGGGGGGGGTPPAPTILWTSLSLTWKAGSSGRAYPGSVSDYASTAVIPTAAAYSFNSGFHYFNIGPGTYSVNIRGAEGSGSEHGYGAIILATLVVTATTRLVAIVGNPGTGSYSGGGMTALAIRSDSSDTYTGATPLLVAGGGGGGYSSRNSEADAGGTSWTPTTRRGTSTTEYDAGASFPNIGDVSIYSNSFSGQGGAGAQHWVWGALGGRTTPCGSDQGGFGGGGGSCPAGGGGYYGGKAGGSGYGGGGGTSYRLSTVGTCYISTWSDVGTNGSSRGSNPGTAGGSFTITSV